MQIGLYKLGVYSFSNKFVNEDKNGRFKELLLLKEVFEKQGHKVEIIKQAAEYKEFDAIFVLNGMGTFSEIMYFIGVTKFLGYIMTDLRLNYDWLNFFDVVYTQSENFIPKINNVRQIYSGMPELALYAGRNSRFEGYTKFDKKEQLFLFGGGMRNREKAIKDYVIDNGLNLLSKGDASWGGIFDTRVPIDDYHELLLDTKYSIVINDPEYNEFGFITWRYFENIVRGVITFVDYKCDINNHLGKDKFMVVSSGNEMFNKIIMMEIDHDIRKDMLMKQFELIGHTKLSGKYTVDCLLGGI